MIAFPDTSFLCAFYRRQDNSPQAAAYFKVMREALQVSGLLLYEFRQSVRFQVWLHARDKSKGYPQADGDRALADLQTDLDTGALVVVTADWPDVHRLAETLSKRHTMTGGHRSWTFSTSPPRCIWARGNFSRSTPTSANLPPPKN